MHERADVIVVPRLREPHGGLDGADADDALLGAAFDEHEHVARARLVGRAIERCERALDPMQQPIAIGGQRRQALAGALGQREHDRQVSARDRPDEEHAFSVSEV